MQELRKMNGHVIICGFGRVGMQVAQDLHAHGNEFIIIEKDEDIVLHEKDHSDFLFLYGDSTNDETLKNAGIESARAVITCLPKDADNTYVVLAAREFKRDILIVSRASYMSAVSKLRMAGANNVIMPDSLGGSHMASLIANPDVMEFLDIVRVQGYTGANVESLSYEELPEELRGKTIEELEAKKITGATIIGYRSPDGKYHINPDEETVIVPDSRLFVLGSTDQIKKVVEHFHIKHK